MRLGTEKYDDKRYAWLTEKQYVENGMIIERDFCKKIKFNFKNTHMVLFIGVRCLN